MRALPQALDAIPDFANQRRPLVIRPITQKKARRLSLTKRSSLPRFSGLLKRCSRALRTQRPANQPRPLNRQRIMTKKQSARCPNLQPKVQDEKKQLNAPLRSPPQSALLGRRRQAPASSRQLRPTKQQAPPKKASEKRDDRHPARGSGSASSEHLPFSSTRSRLTALSKSRVPPLPIANQQLPLDSRRAATREKTGVAPPSFLQKVVHKETKDQPSVPTPSAAKDCLPKEDCLPKWEAEELRSFVTSRSAPSVWVRASLPRRKKKEQTPATALASWSNQSDPLAQLRC